MPDGTLAQSIVQYRQEKNIVWRVTLAWTAGSGGAFTSTALTTDIQNKINGSYLFSMKTVPGAATAAPTAYGITLLDADSMDIMHGAGASRAIATVEQVVPKQDSGQAVYGPVFTDGNLTLAIASNTNASATGTIYLYFAP